MRGHSCIDFLCTLPPESSTESDSQSYEQSQKSCGQKHLKLRKSGVKKDIYKRLNLGRYIPVELRDFQSRSAFSFCRHLSIYSAAGKKDFPPKRTEVEKIFCDFMGYVSFKTWDVNSSNWGLTMMRRLLCPNQNHPAHSLSPLNFEWKHFAGEFSLYDLVTKENKMK